MFNQLMKLVALSLILPGALGGKQLKETAVRILKSFVANGTSETPTPLKRFEDGGIPTPDKAACWLQLKLNVFLCPRRNPFTRDEQEIVDLIKAVQKKDPTVGYSDIKWDSKGCYPNTVQKTDRTGTKSTIKWQRPISETDIQNEKFRRFRLRQLSPQSIPDGATPPGNPRSRTSSAGSSRGSTSSRGSKKSPRRGSKTSTGRSPRGKPPSPPTYTAGQLVYVLKKNKNGDEDSHWRKAKIQKVLTNSMYEITKECMGGWKAAKLPVGESMLRERE